MISPQLELGIDEQVVWSGHPDPRRYAMEAFTRAKLGGLAMMSVVPLRYRRAKRIVYFITNHRAIIYDKVGSSVEDSYAFDAFPAPGIIDYSDGCCDVVFYTDVPARIEETDLEHFASLVRHGLVAIQNGKEIAVWLPDHIDVCRTKR